MAELPEPRTGQEIAGLAQDFIGNRVWSIEDVPENLVPMVFMPIAMGAFADYTEEQVRQLFVFAVIGKDQAANVGINGYPIFFSLQMWRRDDAIEAFERANAVARMLTGETP